MITILSPSLHAVANRIPGHRTDTLQRDRQERLRKSLAPVAWAGAGKRLCNGREKISIIGKAATDRYSTEAFLSPCLGGPTQLPEDPSDRSYLSGRTCVLILCKTISGWLPRFQVANGKRLSNGDRRWL